MEVRQIFLVYILIGYSLSAPITMNLTQTGSLNRFRFSQKVSSENFNIISITPTFSSEPYLLSNSTTISIFSLPKDTLYVSAEFDLSFCGYPIFCISRKKDSRIELSESELIIECPYNNFSSKLISVTYCL